MAAEASELQLKAIAWLYAALAIVGAAIYLAPTMELAFAALGFTSLAGAAANGPLFAASQTLVAPHMRATSIAMLYFFCNLIGLGLGPLAVGALSDALRATAGEETCDQANRSGSTMREVV